MFPAPKGGYIDLDNWRLREWYPALEAAGLRKRGPYALRHTFATETLAAGASTFDLAEMMGSSLEMIERHYGHLAKGRLDHLRDLLSRRSGVLVSGVARGRRGPARGSKVTAFQAVPSKRTTGLEPATFGLGSRRSTN